MYRGIFAFVQDRHNTDLKENLNYSALSGGSIEKAGEGGWGGGELFLNMRLKWQNFSRPPSPL